MSDAGYYTFSVSKRERGVYLAEWSWDSEDGGQEGYDAFSTEAKAKSYCATVVGRGRLRWENPSSGYWRAAVEVSANV
jgi:hypothetical protein